MTWSEQRFENSKSLRVKILSKLHVYSSPNLARFLRHSADASDVKSRHVVLVLVLAAAYCRHTRLVSRNQDSLSRRDASLNTHGFVALFVFIQFGQIRCLVLAADRKRIITDETLLSCVGCAEIRDPLKIPPPRKSPPVGQGQEYGLHVFKINFPHCGCGSVMATYGLAPVFKFSLGLGDNLPGADISLG